MRIILGTRESGGVYIFYPLMSDTKSLANQEESIYFSELNLKTFTMNLGANTQIKVVPKSFRT
jgi:hypothetical protein